MGIRASDLNSPLIPQSTGLETQHTQTGKPESQVTPLGHQPDPTVQLSQPAAVESPILSILQIQGDQIVAFPVAPLDPPNTVRVTLGTGPQAKVALMPTTGVSPAPGKTVKQTIEQKITEGRKIFDDIQAGLYDHVPQTNKEDTAKVMWYLQALGSAKAHESSGGAPGQALFKEGSFMVEDPQGKLAAYLENSNSYSRSSSHMKDYQSQGREFKPKGVDIRGVSTPNERRTLLFQKIPQGPDQPKMLFIKMEPHGCRGLTCRGSGTPRDHETPSSVWQGVKRFFLNAKDLIMHGLGFMDSILQRAGLMAIDGQNNRERIPSEIKTNYQALLKQFPEEDDNLAYTTLNSGRPLSDSSGLKVMAQNLERILTLINSNSLADTGGLKEQVQNLLDDIRARRDHLDLRIGNEIILTQNELPQLLPQAY